MTGARGFPSCALAEGQAHCQAGPVLFRQRSEPCKLRDTMEVVPFYQLPLQTPAEVPAVVQGKYLAVSVSFLNHIVDTPGIRQAARLFATLPAGGPHEDLSDLRFFPAARR